KNVLLTITFCFCLFCGNYKVKTKRAGSSSEEPAIFIFGYIFLPDTNKNYLLEKKDNYNEDQQIFLWHRSARIRLRRRHGRIHPGKRSR
ncbi:hypothetical protein, partial [Fibrobacter sp.]|uniref:hypothetical protein n=1 Tax=Fibrobacter sp. TaxID=35828 RepID=UPI00388DE458